MKRIDLDQLKNVTKNKNFLIIVGILACVLAVIILNTDFSSPKSSAVQSSDYDKEYIEQIEDKLQSIIQDIKGSGKTKVMVTLESGKQYRYASEGKTSNDKDTDYVDGKITKNEERSSSESNYILIDGSSGSQSALVESEIQPEVKGVVVVCEGGDNWEVKKSIIETVTVALKISSAKVTVQSSK